MFNLTKQEVLDIFNSLDTDKQPYSLAYSELFYNKNPKKLLEIGVFNKGGLQSFKSFFPDAIVYGLDINEDCAGENIFIGSQEDKNFLNKAIEKTGLLDIIIDDGSHFSSHQTISFKYLFQYLKSGGLYIIEDIGTSFYPNYVLGHRPFTDFVHSLEDEMCKTFPYNGEYQSIKFYPHLVAIEKR